MFRPITSASIRHKIKNISKPLEDVQHVTNRNPRNLEKLRIAYKPKGYVLEKPGRNFWHKLEIEPSRKYVTAHVKHFEAGTVITASTSEWCIKKQLFKPNDTCAYINLARVLAQRCLEAGVIEMKCNIKPPPDGKVSRFLETMKENGVSLKEPYPFAPYRPWNKKRPEKPWEVQ